MAILTCPKCKSSIVILYGSKEGTCENCGTPALMKRTVSGTQYALIGKNVPEDLVPTINNKRPSAFPSKDREAIEERNRMIKIIADQMLGFRNANMFRTLSMEQVTEALAQAYEQGKKQGKK